MPRSTRAIIEELLATYDERLRLAFLAAIDDIRNGIVLRVIVERLERGDVSGAIEAMHLDAEAFSRLELAIAEAYNAGGAATVENLPRLTDPEGNRVVFRWGLRNLPGELDIRTYAAQRVEGITEEAREGLRTILSEGLARGDNPTVTARDIVGRRSRATNTRVGGLIGLDSQQMQTADRIKQMMLANDTEAMMRYLGMTKDMIGMPRRELLRLLKGRGIKLRDRRLDSAVIDAIEGKARISQEGAEKVFTRYSERALDFRGRRIALFETMTSLSKSRHDAMAQQIAAGKIDADTVTKVWRHTPQEHPRLHHQAMNDKTAKWGEQFELPNGARVSYPHAPDAPIDETIFCKCHFMFRIDYFAAVERRFRAEAV
jgi:hypothetical protein